MTNAYLVVGAKGGCGVTTLCVDVARAVRRARKAVTIVDADLSGRRSVAELLNGIRELNANRGVTIHAAASVADIAVVELVDKYEDVVALKISELETVAKSISEQGDLVLVDAPRPFENVVSPFVHQASRAIVVMEPDMLGASAARTTVRDLVRSGIPLDRMRLVVNARNRHYDIQPRELEKILGISIAAEVPRNNDKRNYDRVIDALAARLLDSPPETTFMRVRSLPHHVDGAGANGVVKYNRRKTDPKVEVEAAEAARSDDDKRRRTDRRDRIRREINELMVSRVDLVAASRGHTDSEKIARLRESIEAMIDEIVTTRTDLADFSVQDRAAIKQEILDEQLGLGPLEDLMRDPAVSEIMVNGPKQIYVERSGKLIKSDRVFSSDGHLRVVIERIVAPLGRRIDESSPMVDARLPDGSRVNAIIEPLALKGATLTIRRFGTRRLTIDDLVRMDSLPPEAVTFLRAIVEARLNVIVSGGTGTGKTTFLNILSNFIPSGERIVTIEDAAELSLDKEHVVSLESRAANVEGRGSITIRDLVKNSLRMRPDRIVVGECRGGEALDMLQAMNTGHDGSLTTLHANTPRDALARLETLVLMAGFELPIRAIRDQIASAVDVIVQIERMRDGKRKVTSITEVVGMDGDLVALQEVVKFQSRGLDENNAVIGDFQYTGVTPHYTNRFREMGVAFDADTLSALGRTSVAW
ncbi:MAG: hypothetical protein NVSMB19_19150 [Vulcanimicrobiaceae bacterium]